MPLPQEFPEIFSGQPEGTCYLLVVPARRRASRDTAREGHRSGHRTFLWILL